MRPIKITLGTIAATTILLSQIATASESLTVPFTTDRHRIIIPTTINGSKPLQVIFDTGMRFDGVYLFHKELAGQIDTSGAIEVKVPGAGSGEASTAIMIESGTIGFGNVTVDSQRVIISKSEQTQTFPTDGVIGWNLLGHYIVEINYDSQFITLHDSSYTSTDTTWTILPIELKDNIPWLDITAEVVEEETVPMRVYIDLASGDVLELLTGPNQRFTNPANLDSSYLGTGLSGDIYGHVGRTRHITIGGHELTDLPTAFAPAAVRSKQDGADGILGNGFIERFNVILDFYRGLMYFRPNDRFGSPFEEREDH